MGLNNLQTDHNYQIVCVSSFEIEDRAHKILDTKQGLFALLFGK